MTLQVCRENLRDLLKDDFISGTELNTLIRRAERKMERDLVKDGEFKPQQMIADFTGTTTATGLVLPSDYQRMRTVIMNGNPMRWASPEKMRPGSQPEDVEATLYYYKRLPALTDSESNWLFDLAEDLYMYAGALQGVPHQRDTENAGLWTSYYLDALESLREANKSQPTGSWQQWKGRPYKGLYTVQDGSVRFDGGRVYGT